MTRRFLCHILLCLLAVLPLAGMVSCQRDSASSDDKTGVFKPVRLSLSLGSFSGTKADVDHFTELIDKSVDEVEEDFNPFRGLSDIKMVAYAKAGDVEADKPALNIPIDVPAFESFLYPNVQANFYPSGIDTFIPIGTSSVLLYGRAPGDAQADEVTNKRCYGSLIPHGLDTKETHPTASSIGFSPDVIFSEENTPDEAGYVARVVNHIMLGVSVRIKTTYRPQQSENDVVEWATMNWDETVEDSNLREAYTQITNDGAFIPGSGPMVESLLSSLYTMLKGYESHNNNAYEITVNGIPYELKKVEDGKTLLYKDLLNELKKEALSRFTDTFGSYYLKVEKVENEDDKYNVSFIDDGFSNYPESIGLPSGAAILRWTPAGFVVPLFGGVEGMAPINRYCYPPALYYYTNTNIVTSQNENIADAYNQSSPVDWSQVISKYELGTSVTSNTLSLALVKPVQFAVGMLSATVQSDRAWLQDNDGLPETTIYATGENLPVTGIILSGQYAQNFDFTPVENAEEYFSFDSETPGVYLTKDPSAPIRTLSLPTPEGKDVYFTLEFLNNSGKIFYGADGRVLPGRKFYMVGKLELPAVGSAERKFESVFVKDHKTNVKCTIKSLAGAYNAVPDLGNPQLVIGIQTRVNWALSTPTTIPLE